MPHNRDFDHVEPIPSCPPLFERETGQSYLGRLLAFFGYQSLYDFCTDLGLDKRGIQWGEEPALRHLAAVTKADADELIRWTPVRIDKNRYRLGGVETWFDIGPRTHVLQCPACARETIAANPDIPKELCLYGRAEWSTGYFDACPVHHVRLVRRITDPQMLEHLNVAYARTEIYEALDLMEDEPATPTSFELHALSVILRQQDEAHFLASLTLDGLFRLSRALGTDIANNAQLVDPDPRTIQSLGFDAIAGGPEGLHKLFLSICSRLPARFKAQNTFSNMLRCLSRTPRAELIQFRSMVIQLLFRTFPSKPGHKLLGIACTERKIYTFTSARLAYKVPRELLHTFAKGTPGLATRLSEKRDDILIDKEVADVLFVGRTPFQTTWKLRNYFGRNPHDTSSWIEMFVEAGILSGPIQDAALVGTVPVFSRPQVEKEVARFLAPFQRVKVIPADMISPRIAVARTKISLVGLLTLLAQRRLSKVAVLEGVSVMDSLFVDREEILQVLTGNGDPVTKSDAARILGINGLAMATILRDGWLRPIAPAIEGIKCNLNGLLARSEVEAFRARYLRLSDTRDLTGGRSYSDLLSQGLKPVIFFDPKLKDQGRTIFYDRDDIEEFLKRRAA